MHSLSGISGQKARACPEFLWKIGASGRAWGVKESAEEQADSHSHKENVRKEAFLSKLYKWLANKF